MDELIAESRGAPGQMPDDMPGWMSKIISGIDLMNLWVGRIVCWMVFPIFISMICEIFLRKFFTAPTVWAYDLSRMLYGAMFMLGAGYALSKGVHIRADFLYRTLPVRVQAGIDALLYLILYFPGLGLFFWYSLDFAVAAWERGERGMDTAWMPHMGPIKTTIPLGVALLLIQGVSELLKCFYAISRGKWPS